MGWCSGTRIFDDMCEVLLPLEDLGESEKKRVIRALVTSLEEQDWDCFYDSEYCDNYIVKMAMRELHPNWEEYE